MKSYRSPLHQNCKGIRNNEHVTILKSEIVVGDLVILTPGFIVPCDGIFVEENNLKACEASLTGESIANIRNE